MPSSTSSSDARAWRRFARVLAGTGGGALLAVWLFVVLVDPFGRLPLSLPFDRGPVDSNARYAFPMLARSQRFDSAMFGTSTTRLLRPAAFDAVFGTRFANLAMNSATAWEQSRLFDVFAAAHPAPRMVLFGLDTEWCEVAATFHPLTDRPFPEWLYSGSPWAGYRAMADLYSVEKAGQAFAEWTGLKRRVYGRDGYTRFVPDESRYDPVRVAALMRDAGPYEPPPHTLDDPARAVLPGIELLRADLARLPAATTKLLVFVPYNHRIIPLADTPGRALLAECKRRVADLAAATPNAAAVDFMIVSPITRDDANYWDPHHYRVGIAERIVADIAGALRGDTSDDYVALSQDRVQRLGDSGGHGHAGDVEAHEPQQAAAHQ